MYAYAGVLMQRGIKRKHGTFKTGQYIYASFVQHARKKMFETKIGESLQKVWAWIR